MKKVILILALALILTGCKNTLLGGWSNWFGSNDVGTGFVLDNDAVFDLFQDDFGTGTQYDDRFIDSGDGDVGVGGTGISADGQTDYSVEPTPTVDPAYDKIGKMTPGELHGKTFEIPVLTLGANQFPFPAKQFGELAEADRCDHVHYHGASGYTLDRNNIPEPANPCGFDNSVSNISMTGDELIEWFHNRPRNF